MKRRWWRGEADWFHPLLAPPPLPLSRLFHRLSAFLIWFVWL